MLRVDREWRVTTVLMLMVGLDSVDSVSGKGVDGMGGWLGSSW